MVDSTGIAPTGPAALAEPPTSGTSIEVLATTVLSYALAHNRVPVVSRVAISHTGAPVSGAALRLSVHDAQGVIGSPIELLVDLDPAGTTVLTDVPLRLDAAAMLQVEEQRPGTVEV